MSAQQFEHDGFNSPKEVEVAQREQAKRTALRGFGVVITPGGARNWYCGADGVKRWVNNDKPCDGGEA